MNSRSRSSWLRNSSATWGTGRGAWVSAGQDARRQGAGWRLGPRSPAPPPLSPSAPPPLLTIPLPHASAPPRTRWRLSSGPCGTCSESPGTPCTRARRWQSVAVAARGRGGGALEREGGWRRQRAPPGLGRPRRTELLRAPSHLDLVDVGDGLVKLHLRLGGHRLHTGARGGGGGGGGEHAALRVCTWGGAGGAERRPAATARTGGCHDLTFGAMSSSTIS